MFSSPMSHLFRHVFVSYRQHHSGLRQKLFINRELNSLEAACTRLLEKNPRHPKIPMLLERIRSVKEKLKEKL